MSWNRQTLLKEGRKAGFTGKTAAEFSEWADENGVSFKTADGMELSGKNLENAFDKTVTITANAGEEVVIEGVEGAEMGDEILDDEEVKMGGEDEAEDELKMFNRFRAQQKSAQRSKQANGSGVAIHTKAGRVSGTDFAKKQYDQAVKTGATVRQTRKTPLFYNADRCEWFGAKARLVAMGGRDYSQKANDENIVSQKDGLAGINTTGGALVFNETLPELIENLEEGGVAREMIGVTAMRDGQQTVSKISSDVTITDMGEGETITASDPIFGNVELVAGKTGAMAKESNELLNDAAFNVGDIVGRSMLRATGIFEDSSTFLGSNNRQGCADLVGANSTYDAALASSWSQFTIDDIQDWLGKLPEWTMKDPNFGIVCSLPFYMRVLRRFALSAGGTTGDNLLGGVAGGYQWDGIKVGISQVMPLTYAGNALVAYAGAWGNATKMGVVTGSERLDASDQRFFDEDKVAFRRTQRWTFNGHDINNTTNSGIVALQD